jgi:peptidoglycan/xylan/chitin deacetylase (PgdA/CDA1 family)
VAAGDVITFVPGADSLETTRTRDGPVGLDPAAAALYLSYAPGRGRLVQGVLSGEQVSSTLLSAPTVGRLRSPAWLSFTFDDGPDELATPQVLALLAARHTPAVFCLIGVDAQAHPGLARTEASGGYRLCDHTQTHPLNLPELPAAQILAEIRTGELSVIQADGGVAPVYFRAPGGNWSAIIEADARSLHLIPLSWTVDPRDWSRPGTEQIITSVLNQLRPNGIILMHDGGGNRAQTIAALTRLLPELAAAGWSAGYPS